MNNETKKAGGRFMGSWLPNLLGVGAWTLGAVVLLAVLFGACSGVQRFIAQADWKLIKSVITWFVFVRLFWLLGSMFQAKARKP